MAEDVSLKESPDWKQRNLGVNGTGQKRNVTRDLPSLRNMFPSKSIPELTLNNEDEPGKTVNISPHDLSPEDVGVGDEIDKKDLENNNITSFKTVINFHLVRKNAIVFVESFLN